MLSYYRIFGRGGEPTCGEGDSHGLGAAHTEEGGSESGVVEGRELPVVSEDATHEAIPEGGRKGVERMIGAVGHCQSFRRPRS